MKLLMTAVMEQLRRIGFNPFERTALLKDLLQIFLLSDHRSRDAINRELESLGWGIQLMDSRMHREFMLLVNNIDETAVDRYFRHHRLSRL